MVYKMNNAGTAGWHEPPYTSEEEMELYRRVNAGPMTVYRGPKKGADPAKDKKDG